MCKHTTMRRDYESVARFCINVYEVTKHDAKQLEILKNGLRNIIFDLGEAYTGYASESAIATGLPKSKLTGEHIFPRNQSAKQILRRLSQGPISVERLALFLRSRCRVHITTKEENLALVPFQKQDGYHWRKGYRDAGISLVEYDFPRKNKYVYIAEGIRYNSINEIAQKYGMSNDGVRYRVRSKSNKFKEWSRERIS